MTYKIVSQLSSDGFYVCEAAAYESPLEPGIFLIPRNCIDVRPPNIGNNLRAKWDGTQWQYSEVPTVEEIPPSVPPAFEYTPEELRAAAYMSESDPLYFKWQRGASTQQAWLDKIAEIKLRYPDV